MTTMYAAWLRGIMPSNPNMRNEKLRGVFTGLGFDPVASVLSSGNIVFGAQPAPAAELEARIQEALHAELGIPGATIIRSHAELRALIDRDPFAGYTHSRETYLTATFFKETAIEVAAPQGAEVAVAEDGFDRVVGYDAEARAFLMITDNTAPKTPNFMVALERNYGTNITTRTWLTVRRVVDKIDSVRKPAPSPGGSGDSADR